MGVARLDVPVTTSSVLVVEDERRIARLIELELVHEGFHVEIASDGVQGLRLALEKDFGVILLDVMLPGMSGLEVCRMLRKHKQTPIIILTARDSTDDKVAGLDAGADDYVTKPFVTEELLARVRAALRRGTAREELAAADLKLYPEERRAIRAGKTLELTTREFDLLQFLLRNVDKVLSRDVILRRVWGYDFEGETNVVDVYIRYLRMKVDEPFAVPLIHTIRGVGYVLRRP
ncbi:response regulator transcription factor [Sulfoacidibacillus thermotolerans]|uniref:DNA-binding response regulator n=1 Tax=Sulfoacidibacillus thermotolerans TaxID=1765684 RepID=A0A2U3D9U8_SULT2|nr:response regulator transcription factor [Sulfoacidibacillus thermotolerans]PWI58059.1 DNA-binding response regulator [Sulfoacidibacillus thermotolerans]